jgi:hypothetical protein
MNPAAAACPQCQSSLPGALCNTGAPVNCPVCDSVIQVELFPALFEPVRSGLAAETILEPGVSGCFYHDQKKAIVHCDGCGRFLCALCDLEFDGQHLCPPCLQAGRKKGSFASLENRRTLYDGTALSLALFPILLGPLSILTAPAAIVFAVISFRKPNGLVSRTRIRAYAAIVLALVQMAVWVMLIYTAIQQA